MVLFLVAPALMTYSFVGLERSNTQKRTLEQFGNFGFNLLFMGAHFFFMPDLQIWYSKAVMDCRYDSVFEGSDKALAFGYTWIGMESPEEECTNSTTEKCDYKAEDKTKTVTEKKDFPFDNDATEDFGDLDDGDIDFDNLHGGPIDAHF